MRPEAAGITQGQGGTFRRTFGAALVAACVLAAASRATGQARETLWDALNAPPADNGPAATTQPAPAAGQTPNQTATGKQGRKLANPLRFLDDFQRWLRTLGSATKSDLKISGQHNFRYHVESVSGSRDSYDNSTYYGRRSLGGGYTDTDVTVSGKLLGLVSFETRYTDNVYGNPYDNRIKLSYQNKAFSVEAGDIQAGVTGNSLVDFTRSLNGVTVSANVAKGIKLSTLYSQEKAQTRTIVINGANRAGPYYVFAGQVVDGSAKVRVNNRDMVLGQDYTMDPYTGELNFLNGLIIHELDTIAVTFETYGYNQSPGLLTGWRADVTAFKPVRLGVTYLSQIANRSAGRNATKTEQFYGYNSATTPYVLELPVEVTLIRDEDGKITGCVPVYPMTVTIGVLPQTYGTDYVLDPLLPNRVYFKMAVPSTQIIRIEYRPASADASSGDRGVLGFDINTSLGKLGSITAEMASSTFRLSNTSTASSAWQIRSDMKLARDKLKLNWAVKNIGADFTAIQSPGFRRNDRGITLAADYQASSRLKLSANVERSKRPAYNYTSYSSGSSGLSQAAGTDDYSQLSLRANLQLGKDATLSLVHNAMGTRMGLGGDSTHETDTLTYQQGFGQLNLDLSLGRQKASTMARYSTTGGSGADTQTASYGSDSLNARLGAKWRLGERLSFDTIFTNSSIKSADGKRNTAQDITLNARSIPLRNLTLTVGYSLQSSGGYSLFSGYTDYSGSYGSTPGLSAVTRQVGSAGYLGSGFTGYYGGGVNGGLGTYGNYSGGFGAGGYGLGSASFGGNSRGLNIAANYQPWPTVSLDLTWSNASSIGDYLFNSKRDSLSLSANYNPGERLSLAGGILMQNVSYVGSSGGTSTTGLYLNAMTKPYGKLQANLNYNIMRSSTTAATSTGTPGDPTGGYYGGGYGGYFGSGGTNLSSYGIRLEYPVWLAANLFVQFDSADSTGYLASNQRTLAFGFAFDLGNNTQFQLGWRDQKYLSKAAAGSSDYSYHVRSLDADIGLRF